MPSSPRILVIAPDRITRPQFGPNIRALALARQLAAEFDVTFAIMQGDPPDAPALAGLRTTSWSRENAGALADIHHIVLSQGMQYTATTTVRTGARQVFDLYDPVLLEYLTGRAQARQPAEPRMASFMANITTLLLRRGDFFLCASPQQRDLWSGGLYASGRLWREGGDPNDLLGRLIGIVPFGHDGTTPRHTRPALRGVVPGIGPDDRVLLWGGGIWNWFDPLVLIRAVAGIAATRPDVKLFFMASRHPDPSFQGTEMIARAVALATELGVLGHAVFFADSWVPFDERANYLLEADLAVCTAPESPENQFSFRTRLTDAVWAGVPIVCTRGGFFGDFVAARGIGTTVPGGDEAALRGAILDALEPATHARFKERIAACRAELGWESCAAPLLRFCREVRDGLRPPRREPRWRPALDFFAYKAATLIEGTMEVPRP